MPNVKVSSGFPLDNQGSSPLSDQPKQSGATRSQVAPRMASSNQQEDKEMSEKKRNSCLLVGREIGKGGIFNPEPE